MSKSHLKAFILLLLLLSFPANSIVSAGQNGRWKPELISGNPDLAFDSGKVRVGFLQNKAQALEEALYNSPAYGSSARQAKSTEEMLQFAALGHVLGFRQGEMFTASGDHALRVEFVQARPVSPVEGTKSSGEEANGRTAQPVGKVSYRELWEGVTLVYEKDHRGLVKSTYFVRPGGTGDFNPVEHIRLRYNMPVRIDEEGNLLLSFATGEMRETRPVAWQEIEGKRISVEVAYRLIGEKEVGFKAGSYDSRHELVIDPLLSWNTFLGSSYSDHGYGTAVDTSGNVYVAGESFATWGTPVNPYAGGYEVFAAKLSSSGARQWNTFLGSSGTDWGYAIAVDTSGNVYVAGYSDATWGTPVNPHAGGQGGDAFVAKLNSSGVRQWNTFLGSSTDDWGYAIAVDTSGNVYVAGYSVATWGTPVNPFAEGIYRDAFVAKLNSSGVRQWNTFMGATDGNDYGNAIAVDTSGNVYVAGYSYKTWGTPVNPYAAGHDAFVAKLNSSGARQWNTFMGSTGGNDHGYAIAVDTSGNVYVAGESMYDWGTPVNPLAGPNDAFVAKLNSSGVRQWNTFMGSVSNDYGRAIAVDTTGSVYVAGSSEATWGTPANPHAGGYDAYVAKLNSSGARQWNTFVGSGGSDAGRAIAVDTRGNIFVAGDCDTTWGTPINPYAGPSDAFVAKIQDYIKNDFNGDGKEDILWRYYGSGGYNYVWYMGQSGGFAGLQMMSSGVINMFQRPESGKAYWDPREVGGLAEWSALKVYGDPREAGGLLSRTADKAYRNAWEAAGSRSRRAKTTSERESGRPGRAAETPLLESSPEDMVRIQGLVVLGGASLSPVLDTNWQIAGTGDFNSDQKADILWRHYGTGENYVWYMDGVTVTGGALLPTISDTSWQIGGTGDFNGDGKVDILWRNHGTGLNYVWYMNGVTVTGGALLPEISDTSWQIAGTGDFNGDGKVDILWRSYSSGLNYVWYMNGVTVTGGALLPEISDTSWQIAGTGDFNGDGKVDILWRSYSSGLNYVWYMNGVTCIGADLLVTIADLNWRIVNH